MLPRGYLSPSQVNMFNRCEMQYYHRYIKDVVIPPAWAIVKGTALDKACQEDMTTKMKTGKNISESRIYEVMSAEAEIAVTQLDPSEPQVEEQGGPEKVIETFIGEIPKIAREYKNWGDAVEPVGVQESLRSDVGGFPHLLVLDVRHKDYVTDLKFSSRRKSPLEAENNNQLRLQQIVSKRNHLKVDGAALFSIYPVTNDYKGQTLNQSNSPEAEKRMESMVYGTGRKIETGLFAPVNLDSKNSWVCSAKYCGYWRTCAYGEKGRSH